MEFEGCTQEFGHWGMTKRGGVRPDRMIHEADNSEKQGQRAEEKERLRIER